MPSILVENLVRSSPGRVRKKGTSHSDKNYLGTEKRVVKNNLK